MHHRPLARRVLHVVADPRVPIGYRLALGLALMIVGTMFAKLTSWYPQLECVSMGCEVIGYFVHGAGCIPFLDWMFVEAD